MLVKRPFRSASGIDVGTYDGRGMIFDESASQYASVSFGVSPTIRTGVLYSFWMKPNEIKNYAHYILNAGSGSTFIDGIDSWEDGTAAIRIVLENTTGANVSTPSGMYLRDYSAWIHVVVKIDTTQATSSDRIKVWINGIQQTLSGSFPSLNYTISGFLQSTYTNYISKTSNTTRYYNGYLADLHAVDADASNFSILTASDFGYTSKDTGEWVPRKYNGSHGTNGFHLDFSDTTSFTTVFNDKSGNGNHFTPAGYSGIVTDYAVLDTPVDNYAILATNFTRTTLSKGATVSQEVIGGHYCAGSTMSVSDGKWYVESRLVSGTGLQQGWIADNELQENFRANWRHGNAQNSIRWQDNETTFVVRENGTDTLYSDFVTTPDNSVVGILLDLNNSQTAVILPDGTQGPWHPIPSGKTWTWAMGGSGDTGEVFFREEMWVHTPPLGFKALSVTNLQDPAIKNPADNMDVALYTGTGAAQNITGLNFQPDLVWLKDRTAVNSHHLFDSVRGATKLLQSDNTSAEATDANSLTDFNTDGFSIGTLAAINTSGNNYVAWNWKKGAVPGFDIVSYVGDGVAGRTVSHSLGVKPDLIIVKNRDDSTTSWVVYHSARGATVALVLSDNRAEITSTISWDSTEPTSSVFTVGNSTDLNGNGDNLIAYLFAAVEGFSAFGQYTGNGSADGPFVYCGFRPAFVIVKRIDTTSYSWQIYDSSRDYDNTIDNLLKADTSDAEAYLGNRMDLVCNGFKVRTTSSGINASGGTYVYMAFAESPFKYARGR